MSCMDDPWLVGQNKIYSENLKLLGQMASLVPCKEFIKRVKLQCPLSYRDDFDRSDTGSVGICKPCECSGNEQTCQLENEKLTCICKDGFEGEKCNKVAGSPGKYFSNHGNS